jgi:hypothetical protein
MRRLVLLVTLLLAAGGCSKSPCQELGEKLCACTGLSTENCTTQVQSQLNSVAVDDSTCESVQNACNDHKPHDADFCTWLTTADGKRYCGLAPLSPQ